MGEIARPKIRVRLLSIAAALFASSAALADEAPLAWWTFDDVRDRLAIDRTAARRASIDGHFRSVAGISGDALVFDGYTTALTVAPDQVPSVAGSLTIEAWLAVATYPWNRVPLVDRSGDESHGFAFEIGARGQLVLRTTVDNRVVEVSSEEYALPLRQWLHVAARYDPRDGLALFVDGALVAERPLPDPSPQYGRVPARRIDEDASVDLRIGAVREPRRPAAFHRYKGTRPAWYSLDGVLDELRIYGVARSDRAIAAAALAFDPGPPPLPQRVMPSGPPGPGPFGTLSTTLSYYPEWDALSRVGQYADLVVRFDTSPARVVFWRGTQYSPAWVTGNGLWMADQSIEGYDDDYTWEHMNDKHNRYSHVRVVEQSDARVVVHWRYAPVNVDDELLQPDERLGNGAWIDEYYYFYPDVTGIRKVSWERGTLGAQVQFQESIPLAHPGQRQGEVVEAVYATVGNLHGETQVLEYLDEPERSDKSFPDDLTIQMHHLRSAQKPFIAFEPGNRMTYLRDLDARSLSRPGSSSHWPVARIPSDGRSSQALDRATSFLGFPISEPPINQGDDGRDYWVGLYGMTEEDFSEVVDLARSWVAAPRASGDPQITYDRSERAYRVRPGADAEEIAFTLEASAASPLHNLFVVVENWGDDGATLNIDGRSVPRGQAFRSGHRHTVGGTDLLTFLTLRSTERTTIHLRRKRD